MNPPKHPSSWNPPNHSHWRPDDWTFFSSRSNYEPTRRLYFFLGSNYHSYQRPDNCMFYIFQAVIVNSSKHPSSWNPPNHSHWRPDNWAIFFSGRNYAPAKQLYLFHFQVVIIIPTKGQTTVRFFFQVLIMNQPKHPSSRNPPKHSHWRPVDSTIFFPEVFMNPPDDCTFFFRS